VRVFWFFANQVEKCGMKVKKWEELYAAWFLTGPRALSTTGRFGSRYLCKEER